MLKQKLFIIIDGSFYLYKFYYALPNLINNKGEFIGAIYGVFNMIKKYLLKYKPSHMAIVFDSKKKTFRHKLFKYYKINRNIMPEKLHTQIKPLFEKIQNIGITILNIKGVEADDIIGTLSLLGRNNNCSVLISTGDKDMCQLVSEKIKLINNTLTEPLGPKEVEIKFGLPPNLIIDYLALVGDTSDNIPGVFGIGKKTAVFLLKKFGNLNKIYQNIDNIHLFNTNRLKKIILKLKNYQEIIFLSYKLATIRKDIFINKKYEQFIVK